ncbi:fatty acid desaturase [Puniceibacterium sp. IMCC21224]|uniref:fatty acid desaturase n=1 Tax=Puniceibacterium sp. IMCC21224 TaxID=1618204 RepID=UPI00064E1129|nr:fatty acid desaturase [Puniceibacterium sp. IMCC21224]KMK68108.1 fatty acid desaturase [Puniceibacterium sp. IMCC21224]
MTRAALLRVWVRFCAIEAPTLALLILCYAAWGLGTIWVAQLWLPLGMVLVVLSTALHSSLSHEALHGHPTHVPWLDTALVFPALSVVVPYLRFRDTHLAHHRDAILTDPYDDPESNYLDPAVWVRQPHWFRFLLSVNNRLAGRLVLGPLLGTIAFVRSDLMLAMRGDRAVIRGWLWHIPALGLVLWWMLAVAQMPLWAWGLSVYLALSILKIRTFLEHQAHVRARGRTVVIEDRGPLALLFLNNNLHVVHHMHPRVAWYRLPALYFNNRIRYLSRNDGYVYHSYGQIFARYFWRAKDPVPHPLWSKP